MKEEISILLVDDEKDFVATITFWLKAKGYSVDVAYDGPTALKMIEEKRPRIVFLDINMPGMDGIETLRLIRQKYSDLPVIMLTAYGTEKKLAESKKLSISGFFPKDGDFEELAGFIDAALRSHKQIQGQ